MARIVRLTESDLTRLVKRVIQETGRYGSFGNLKRKDFKGDQYYDDMDRTVSDDEIYNIGNDDDFDSEEFDDYESYREKYPEDGDDSPMWFDKGEMGKRMFDTYREKTGKPFKVKTRRSMEEGEGEDKKELSHEEMKKVMSAIWDSMTTAEKKKLITKVDRERKEKGLPSLRPKS